MSNRLAIASEFYSNSVRIQDIIWIPSQVSRTSDEFDDFLEDYPELAAQFFGSPPPDPGSDYEPYVEAICETRHLGYLVKAYTPLPQGGGLSWGFSRPKWFYFPEWDEKTVKKALIEWADQLHEEEA